MSDVNLIVTCTHSKCPYWCDGYEEGIGVCGKDVLYLDDKDCIALIESEESHASSN